MSNKEVTNAHKEIIQNINAMLPEKYKKLCLYASIINTSKMKAGEMFFYYFPNGILKRKPINVYEIPNLFNIDEEQYAKLVDRLFESIKKLKKVCKEKEKNNWSNITITIENIKYKIEYNYDNLITSEFDNFERHIIWRFKYLDEPIEMYSKKEREILNRYFNSEEYQNSKTIVYEENIYEKQSGSVMVYNNSVEADREYITKKKSQEKDDDNKDTIKSQILNF